MANGHGGARTPAHPAAVSGPGKYSKRTDGGPAQVMSAAPDQPYGEQTAQMNQQRVAPMGGTAPMPQAATPGGGAPDQPASMPAYHGMPFDRPSERPGEPTTHGVDIGPGGGSDVLNTPASPAAQKGDGAVASMLRNLSATDATGDLATLYQAALTRGV